MFNKSVFFWLRLYSKGCAQTLYNWTLNLKIWEYNYKKCFWTHLTISIFFFNRVFYWKRRSILFNQSYIFFVLIWMDCVQWVFIWLPILKKMMRKSEKFFFCFCRLVLLVVGRDLRISVCERTTSGTKKNLIYLFPVFEILSILGKSNTKNRLTLKSFF